jgi:hypothetical protein
LWEAIEDDANDDEAETENDDIAVHATWKLRLLSSKTLAGKDYVFDDADGQNVKRKAPSTSTLIFFPVHLLTFVSSLC